MHRKGDHFGQKLKKILYENSRRFFTQSDQDLVLIDAKFLLKTKYQLIQMDISQMTSEKLILFLEKRFFNRKMPISTVKEAIFLQIKSMIEPYTKPIEIDSSLSPQTIIFCGANGVGKTTTIAKMCHMLSKYDWKTTVAACDIFRDTATNQLIGLTNRYPVTIVTQNNEEEGTLGIAKRAYNIAKQNHSDLLLIDTAGRMQNKDDMMKELRQMIVGLSGVHSSLPHEIVLVIDATNGQFARQQVRGFIDKIGVTGLVVTKIDGVGRPGIVVSLIDEFRIPVHGLGVGDGVEDLQDFYAGEFASNLVGFIKN